MKTQHAHPWARWLALASCLVLGAIAPAWAQDSRPYVVFDRSVGFTASNEAEVLFSTRVTDDPGGHEHIVWEHTFGLEKRTSPAGELRLVRDDRYKGFEIGFAGATLSSRPDSGVFVFDRPGAEGGTTLVIPHDWQVDDDYELAIRRMGPTAYLVTVLNKTASLPIAAATFRYAEDMGNITSTSVASTRYGIGPNERCEDVRYARGEFAVASVLGTTAIHAFPLANEPFANCPLADAPGASPGGNLGSRALVLAGGTNVAFASLEVGLARAPTGTGTPSAWTYWSTDPWNAIHVRLEADGNLGCYSKDGIDCDWQRTPDDAPLTDGQPVVCGPDAYNELAHWCNAAYADTFARWDATDRAKLPTGDLMCYSTDGLACAPRSQDPLVRSLPLVCGKMHLGRLGHTGYDTPGHWCVTQFFTAK